MTDKEFKKLSRSQLIDIIYQFQLKQEELVAENEQLKKELEDKRLRMAQAGNIAEAALAVNNVMQHAQNAAQQYLDEIRAMHSELEEECNAIRRKATEEAAEIIAQARREAGGVQSKEPNKPVGAVPTKTAAPKTAVVVKKPAVEAPVKRAANATPPKKTVKQSDILLEEILSEFGSSSEL